MPTATSAYVALGRIEHNEHIHEVSDVVDDMDEMEAKRLVALGVLLPVKGASAVAFAQSLAQQRTEDNISSLQAGQHQRVLAEHEARGGGQKAELDALRAENEALRAQVGTSAIHAPSPSEIKATQAALDAEPAVADVSPADLNPTGTGSAEDQRTLDAAAAKKAEAEAKKAAAEAEAAAKAQT